MEDLRSLRRHDRAAGTLRSSLSHSGQSGGTLVRPVPAHGFKAPVPGHVAALPADQPFGDGHAAGRRFGHGSGCERAHPYSGKAFTPIINGMLILLMVLSQNPAPAFRRDAGCQRESAGIGGEALLTAVSPLVIPMAVFTSSYRHDHGDGFGGCFGHLTDFSQMASFSLPKAFCLRRANGHSHDPSAFVLISMEEKMKRSIFFHGLAAVMTGVFFVHRLHAPVSSIGVVEMTRWRREKPMYLAAGGMIFIGLAAPFGALFATIPRLCGKRGIDHHLRPVHRTGSGEFGKVRFESRENLIVGLSLIIGVGIMFLPAGTF